MGSERVVELNSPAGLVGLLNGSTASRCGWFRGITILLTVAMNVPLGLI